MIANAKDWFDASYQSRLEQPDDLAKNSSSDHGEVVLVAYQGDSILVPKSQAWFWTEAWQRGVQASIDDYENGRFQEYENGDDFFSALKDVLDGE